MSGFWHPAFAVRLSWHRVVPPVLLAVAAMGAGVAGGALAAGLLPVVQQHALDAYLGSFFRGLVEGSVRPSPASIFRDSFGSQALLAALVWCGGLFAIGLPLTLGALFVRGFTLGFTVAFLASQEGVGGLLLAVAAILPGSLVSLPVALVLGSVAAAQSLRLLGVRLRRSPPTPGRRDLAAYGALAVACGLALAVGSLVDGYLVPPLLRAVGPALGIS